jgi:hypothetical protein
MSLIEGDLTNKKGYHKGINYPVIFFYYLTKE